MIERRVVLADHDPARSRAFENAILEGTARRTASDPIDLIACTTARAALNACCALEPDCLVTSMHLPDFDGTWLVDGVRAQPAVVSAIPIVIVAQEEDEATRVKALKSGADVLVSESLHKVELVAQVRALIAMAERVRERRSMMPSSIPDLGSALSGDLDRMPVASVLGALELERRSGELWLRPARGSNRKLALIIASGVLAGGREADRMLEPIEALRAALDWTGRRFEFIPGLAREAPEGSDTIGSLLLSAIRGEDRASTLPQKPAPSVRTPAPGRALVEEVVRRSDPRADVDSDAPTPVRPIPPLIKSNLGR